MKPPFDYRATGYIFAGQFPEIQTCDNCPFGTLNTTRNSPESIANDPSEAYYHCGLLVRKDVWGEDPDCTPDDWLRKAKDEIGWPWHDPVK